MSDEPSTAELADVTNARGLLSREVGAQYAGAYVLGPAYAFRYASGDNLAFHVAVARAPRGSVLVGACGRPGEHGVFGALLARAAERAGLRGLVTDGLVRDVAELRAAGFPAFAAGRCARKASKRDPGAHDVPVVIGGVTVATGDLVCGDDDGVVVVGGAHADEALRAARDLRRAEAELIGRINQGETTLAALGLEDAAETTRST